MFKASPSGSNWTHRKRSLVLFTFENASANEFNLIQNLIFRCERGNVTRKDACVGVTDRRMCCYKRVVSILNVQIGMYNPNKIELKKLDIHL